MKTEALSIDLLRIDADTQSRVKISEETVDDYAELITASGKAWPLGDLAVFHDGTDYFVADGFHRTLAAQRVKRASIPCQIHKGTAKDARIFGMTANDRHGLRMSRADKRHCVEWLLDNGGKLTQVEIAEKAGVAVITVKRIVAERKAEKVSMIPFETQNTGKTDQTSSPGPQKGPASPAQITAQTKQAAAELDETDEPGDEPPAETSTASIVLDALDREIPPAFRPANELSVTLLSVGRELDKYRQQAKKLSEQPGGEWLRMQQIDESVRALKGYFQDARYHTVCTQCAAKGCQKCQQNGWLPDYLKGTVN